MHAALSTERVGKPVCAMSTMQHNMPVVPKKHDNMTYKTDDIVEVREEIAFRWRKRNEAEIIKPELRDVPEETTEQELPETGED